MLQFFSTLCFFTYITTGSSAINNEVIVNALNADIKFNDVMWHNHDVADGDYPFIVTLAFIEETVVTRHCTGSLIHPNWVLSSAHCFYDLLDRKFYAWYGNFTVSPLESKLFSSVLNIYIHPDFFTTKFTQRGFFFGDNDISLLKVGKVILPAYGRLSNVDHSKMYGLTVKYIGGSARYFGLASKYVGGLRKKTGGSGKNIGGLAKKKRAGEQFKPLQVGEGIVINCGMGLTLWSKYVLCIAPKCSDKPHHPLHGDFGGPFIYDGKIVGVMSLSFQIPKTFLYSNGLTPVSPYRDWINHVTHVTRLGKSKLKKEKTLQEKLEICEEKVSKCNITN